MPAEIPNAPQPKDMFGNQSIGAGESRAAQPSLDRNIPPLPHASPPGLTALDKISGSQRVVPTAAAFTLPTRIPDDTTLPTVLELPERVIQAALAGNDPATPQSEPSLVPVEGEGGIQQTREAIIPTIASDQNPSSKPAHTDADTSAAQHVNAPAAELSQQSPSPAPPLPNKAADLEESLKVGEVPTERIGQKDNEPSRPHISNTQTFSPTGAPQENALLTMYLDRWRFEPTGRLQFLRESDVKLIADQVTFANEREKASARAFFRKVMLATPLWYPAPQYIQNEVSIDLLYTSDEAIKVEGSRRETSERQQVAEGEIVAGVSPWLARIHQNRRSSQNPYVVGFYQDEEDGRIRPVFGERFFRSQRQIENTIFSGRTEAKEVNLLTAQFQRVENPHIYKSHYWDLLPEDLRTRFEGGEILVTGGSDAYALSDEKIDELASSTNPSALQEHVQMTMQTLPDGYHLLYYSDYQDDSNGRMSRGQHMVYSFGKNILCIGTGVCN